MIRLLDTVIPIRYSKKDIKSREWLIQDISETIAKKLSGELKHTPLKCTVILTFNSAYDNTKGKGLGLKREKSRDNCNGVHNKKRFNKSDKRASK